MIGRLIFLTMTALPESEAATDLVLNALFSKTRRIASATAAPSMMAPSTMLSGGIDSMAKAITLKPLPTAFSSTALTALDPMSRPTTDFDLPRPNTVLCPHSQKWSVAVSQSQYQRRWRSNSRIPASPSQNCHGVQPESGPANYKTVSQLQIRGSGT